MITINQTQHIVQLTEEEAKRVAEESIKDYKSMTRTITAAGIVACGVYVALMVRDAIRVDAAKKKLDESVNEMLNLLAKGKDNADTEA
ncbi:MAG: hypothetical protein IJ087_17800 [Eggerthellaceae bacterium]|nr:hypothetical protein [Eggerthellaceae bacterium]